LLRPTQSKDLRLHFGRFATNLRLTNQPNIGKEIALLNLDSRNRPEVFALCTESAATVEKML
jgi:hypothetical protein